MDERAGGRGETVTCVDEVVGIVFVVAGGAGLFLVELGVLDFFELDHGFLLQGRCCPER